MKRAFNLLITLIICMYACVSFADNSHIMTIVNHFDAKLDYTIGINPQIIPDLPENFSLEPGGKISAEVLDTGIEAYIRVATTNKRSAFWGIEVMKNKLMFHGYLDIGIAYSWKGNTITFCTPEEYKQKNHC